MTDESRESGPPGVRNWPGLLVVARELQGWVRTLPTWTETASESWQQYSRRRNQQEMALVERLCRLPGCRVIRAERGAAVTLVLAGIEARSHGGVAGACKDWIATVQMLAPKLGRSSAPR